MLKLATWDDYVHIKSMCLNFSSASPYPEVPVDPDKIERVITSLLEGDQTKGIIILAMEDDKPVGLIAASAIEMLFNTELIAQEVMYWVEPEYRRGRHALELLNAFEFWAKKVGCAYTMMSLVETEQADKVAKLYERRGYKARERGYLRSIL